jgi:hypothetical protein
MKKESTKYVKYEIEESTELAEQRHGSVKLSLQLEK